LKDQTVRGSEHIRLCDRRRRGATWLLGACAFDITILLIYVSHRFVFIGQSWRRVDDRR